MKSTIISRSVVAGAIGTLTLAVSGIGIAAAANGGSLTLGQSNEASSTTTLKDTNGTPLALEAKGDAPPLKVSNDQLVKHLNADEVGGLKPGEISSGSSAQLSFPLLNPLSARVVKLPKATSDDDSGLVPVSVFETAKLDAGTYSVFASVIADNAGCWADTNSTTRREVYGATDDGENATIVVTVTVKAGQRVHLYCAAAPGGTSMSESTSETTLNVTPVSNDPGYVFEGGMTVLKIVSHQDGKVGQTSPPPAG